MTDTPQKHAQHHPQNQADARPDRPAVEKPRPFLNIRHKEKGGKAAASAGVIDGAAPDAALTLGPKRLERAPDTYTPPKDGLGRYVALGMAAVVLLVGGVGGWAATTEISGAVVASGLLVVDSSVKPIQHPTGGVVKTLNVRNGDKVKAGDLLLQLDETVLRAQMLMTSKQLDELRVREARLKAERDNATSVSIPPDLEARRQSEPHIADAIKGELGLFESRLQAHTKLLDQLTERVAQLKEEISGVESQTEAKNLEIDLIQKELDGLEKLEEQQLVTTNRITNMRREAVRLRGERAQLISAAAGSRGRIAEIEINMLQRVDDRQTEVVKELREVQSKLNELGERKVAATDQLMRVDILAPQDGTIHELAVHAKGAVVQAGNPIMMVVPRDDQLVVEARIPPGEIDRVRYGSTAFLMFTALNQRTTPIINGQVTRISADLSRDEVTGQHYYNARIAIEEAELARLGEVDLIPGMPVDVQIRTEDRTALSYLLKPFTDQAMRAFRER